MNIKKNKLTGFLVMSSFAFVIAAIWATVNHGDAGVYEENGFMENIQVFLLIISAIIYFAGFLKNKGGARLIPLFLSVLCITFVLREVDIERVFENHVIVFLGSGKGRNAIMGGAITLILLAALLKFRIYFDASIKFIRSREGIALITGGILLIIGGVFEKLDKHQIMQGPGAVFIEEFLEMCGYFMMLVSSVLYLSRVGKSKHDSLEYKGPSDRS